MHSFSLPKDSPVTFQQMEHQLLKWPIARGLLSVKRHFGLHTTLQVMTKAGMKSVANFSDIRASVYPDLPDNIVGWDSLVQNGIPNKIFESRKKNNFM